MARRPVRRSAARRSSPTRKRGVRAVSRTSGRVRRSTQRRVSGGTRTVRIELVQAAPSVMRNELTPFLKAVKPTRPPSAQF